MELRQYFALARKWAWLLVLGTVLTAVSALIFSLLSPKVYRASVKLLVNQAQNPAGFTYNDVLTSERLTKTYSQMVRDRPVLEAVIAGLGASYTPEQLASMITVEAIRDTTLLRVSVENTNPTLAKDLANRLAQVFIDQNKAAQLGQSEGSRAAIRDQLSAIERDMANTSTQIDALRTGSAQRSEQERNAEITRLQNLLAQYQSSYATLLKTEQEMRLAEARAVDTVRVTEPAVQPTSPVSPRVTLNTLLAAVVGLILAGGAALLIEYLDDTVKTSEAVEEETGLTTVGYIARIPHKSDQDVLIVARHPRSPMAEAYRTLRTSIQFAGVDRRLSPLLVTSANPGEGKTTTLANLGICMAQAGQRVLLVDCDLRRPSLHRLFDAENKVGLTSLLLEEDPLPSQAIQPTTLPNLSLLPSGPLPPNPAELLSSKRLDALLEKLGTVFDVVLLDSPPVLAVTDPCVLGKKAGGLFLVVDWGHTRIGELRRAAEILRGVGVVPLGVIGNKLGAKSGGHYYYHYSHRYYAEDEPTSAGRPGPNGHGPKKTGVLVSTREEKPGEPN